MIKSKTGSVILISILTFFATTLLSQSAFSGRKYGIAGPQDDKRLHSLRKSINKHDKERKRAEKKMKKAQEEGNTRAVKANAEAAKYHAKQAEKNREKRDKRKGRK